MKEVKKIQKGQGLVLWEWVGKEWVVDLGLVLRTHSLGNLVVSKLFTQKIVTTVEKKGLFTKVAG